MRRAHRGAEMLGHGRVEDGVGDVDVYRRHRPTSRPARLCLLCMGSRLLDSEDLDEVETCDACDGYGYLDGDRSAPPPMFPKQPWSPSDDRRM